MLKTPLNQMERYFLLALLVTLCRASTTTAAAAAAAAVSAEESVESSMTIDTPKNLRFFGITKTVATTTTVYNIKQVFVHPTCIVLGDNVPSCAAEPPTTTTPPPPPTTTPQPTAPPVKPVVITPGGTAEVLSAGISIHRPKFPNIQINLPGGLASPAILNPPAVLAVKPLSLNASAAAAISVKRSINLRRNARRALEESIQPSSVAVLEMTAPAGSIHQVAVEASRGEYEIVGLPLSDRFLVPVPVPIFGVGANRVTLVKYDRITVTSDQVLTSAYPVSKDQDRVTLTIGGCVPAILPAYPPCL